MPSEYAWETRAELLDELVRLEGNAGVSPGIGAVYGPEPPSRIEYEALRRQLREAYFAVPDRETRVRMIGLVLELQHRERAEASLQRLSAHRELAQASEGGNWSAFALAITLPVACVWIGYLLAGVPGELGGIVVALALAAALIRDQRRRIDREVVAARERLSVAEAHAKALEERRSLFDAREAATGVESAEHAPTTSATDEARAAAARHGARLLMVAQASSRS